ncbi:hypothetical protein Ddc_14327 [Ditylenchus destructor]|nr:hypothetical protein Ddc_14327 [Ditylenchus destructor]
MAIRFIRLNVELPNSSHAVTSDIDTEQTAEAAKFFQADAIVVTGIATGQKAIPGEIVELPAVGEMGMPQQMLSKAKKEPIPEPNPSNQALKPTGRCEKVANPDTCASPEKGSSPDLCPAVQT